MLPDISDWLRASWADYRRRWSALMAVLAAGGIATLFGVLLPLVPAGILTVAGVGSPWLVWGAASAAALLAGLWLSTWAQAASVRAASTDEDAASALAAGWRQTVAFGWVLTLAMLAIGGGFLLLLLPGLLLSSLLVFAPFYQLGGEGEGLGALELSYARARPHLGPVGLRLFVAWIVAVVPSWIPWVGWLLGPLWAPFGLVALARLAADLKTLSPAPERPKLGPAVMGLSAALVLAMLVGVYGAATTARNLYRSYASGGLTLKAPDPETAQALLAALQGKGTPEDQRKAFEYAVSLSSTALAAPAPPAGAAP